ncbi:hypothetical protein FA13DRAFT_1052212 [Coprinellus micaceus]|uniref:Uncharacterized protein n=1 Tax=Coprinellus micaceus TaxID=71717 RepID=A0A4Y7SWU9_COPMI|nr:hypothetical protein FA13DRAFT_1052212 [Coprinellus micaceus]
MSQSGVRHPSERYLAERHSRYSKSLITSALPPRGEAYPHFRSLTTDLPDVSECEGVPLGSLHFPFSPFTSRVSPKSTTPVEARGLTCIDPSHMRCVRRW